MRCASLLAAAAAAAAYAAATDVCPRVDFPPPLQCPILAPPPQGSRDSRVKSTYNYASPDCGARVHSASAQSQHASAVLHKSRDRYMLTPCKSDEHWVTIELCDEIRVDTVEIAVWEFFSGVVRDVVVSVGEEEQMEAVATFVGKNVRGVQTFALEPTSFVRFIRLDFPSNYGSEFYCPVSQVKVFGMNQLEAFKWEQRKPTVQVEPPKPSPIPRRVVTGHDELLERLVREQARRQPEPTPLDEVLNSTDTKRRTDSESIYAYMTRRLNDLEANSTLVARYIDEQSRMIKTILNDTQHDLEHWRTRIEQEDSRRWEQERMRQEDRIGRIVSQLEAQRFALDADRKLIESQLRNLADQITYERRRGIAQLVILIAILVIGTATRSEMIDALLKPILEKTERRPPREFAPRPRMSLPSRPGRKLARTAHLHQI